MESIKINTVVDKDDDSINISSTTDVPTIEQNPQQSISKREGQIIQRHSSSNTNNFDKITIKKEDLPSSPEPINIPELQIKRENYFFKNGQKRHIDIVLAFEVEVDRDDPLHVLSEVKKTKIDVDQKNHASNEHSESNRSVFDNSVKQEVEGPTSRNTISGLEKTIDNVKKSISRSTSNFTNFITEKSNLIRKSNENQNLSFQRDSSNSDLGHATNTCISQVSSQNPSTTRKNFLNHLSKTYKIDIHHETNTNLTTTSTKNGQTKTKKIEFYFLSLPTQILLKYADILGIYKNVDQDIVVSILEAVERSAVGEIEDDEFDFFERAVGKYQEGLIGNSSFSKDLLHDSDPDAIKADADTEEPLQIDNENTNNNSKFTAYNSNTTSNESNSSFILAMNQVKSEISKITLYLRKYKQIVSPKRLLPDFLKDELGSSINLKPWDLNLNKNKGLLSSIRNTRNRKISTSSNITNKSSGFTTHYINSNFKIKKPYKSDQIYTNIFQLDSKNPENYFTKNERILILNFILKMADKYEILKSDLFFRGKYALHDSNLPEESGIFLGSSSSSSSDSSLQSIQTSCCLSNFGCNFFQKSKTQESKLKRDRNSPSINIINNSTNQVHPTQIRNDLYNNFSGLSNMFKKHKLDKVNKYFGSEISLNYRFLAFQNQLLFFPALVGIIIFIYGLVTIGTGRGRHIYFSNICNNSTDFRLLCPSSSNHGYKTLSSSCSTLIRNYVFDNNASFAYAILMTVFIALSGERWRLLKKRVEIYYKEDKYSEKKSLLFDERHHRRRDAKFRDATIPDADATEWDNSRLTIKSSIKTGGRTSNLVVIFLQFFMYFLILTNLLFGIILGRLSSKSILTKTIPPTFVSNAPDNAWPIIIQAVIWVFGMALSGFLYLPISEFMTVNEKYKNFKIYEEKLFDRRVVFKFINYFLPVVYLIVGSVTQNWNQKWTQKLPIFPIFKIFGVENYQIGYTDIQGTCIFELKVYVSFLLIYEVFVIEGWRVLFRRWKNDENQNQANFTCHPNELKPWEADFLLKPTNSTKNNHQLLNEKVDSLILFLLISVFSIAFPLSPCFLLLKNCFMIRVGSLKYLKFGRRGEGRSRRFSEMVDGWLVRLSKYVVVLNGFVIALRDALH